MFAAIPPFKTDILELRWLSTGTPNVVGLPFRSASRATRRFLGCRRATSSASLSGRSTLPRQRQLRRRGGARIGALLQRFADRFRATGHAALEDFASVDRHAERPIKVQKRIRKTQGRAF